MSTTNDGEESKNFALTMNRVAGVLLFFTILFFIWLANVTSKHEQKLSCFTDGSPIQTITGTVRRVGFDLMLESDKWRRISGVCSAQKNHAKCFESSPHVKLLEASIGKTIAAKTCGDVIFSIELDGVAYRTFY